MKKKLLLLCALMASVSGVWAQNNVSKGLTVVPLGGLYDYKDTDGNAITQVNNENLQLMTAEGNSSWCYLLPENGKLPEDAPIQGFYIDLGKVTSIGSIYTKWNACASAFTVKVTNTKPADDGTLTDATTIYEETALDNGVAQTGKNYVVADGTKGQYVVFEATKANTRAWGVKIFQFIVYDTSAASLSSFTISPAIVAAETATTLTAAAYDASNNAYANVKYQIDGSDVDLATAQTLTAGAHTVTAIDTNDGSITKEMTIYAVGEAAPAAPTAATKLEVYTTSTAATSWNNSTNSELTIAGEKVRLVHIAKGGNINIVPSTVTEDINQYNRAYVAIYPASDFKGALVVYGSNNYEDYNTPLAAGQWHKLDNALDAHEAIKASDKVTSFQINNNSGADIDVLIANAVVYFKDANAFTIDTSVENVAKITGAVTESDVTSNINTADVTLIDLSGIVSITTEAIAAINPLNPNALVSIPATNSTTTKAGFEGLEAVKNAVRVDGWTFPVAQLQFTDANGAKWWLGEGADADKKFISTGTTAGFKVTRSVTADKWLTICTPQKANANATLTITGADVYTFTAVNGDGTLKFEKVTGLLANNTPYIINTTASEVVIAGQGDFGMIEAAGTVEQGDYKLTANLTQKTVAGADKIYGFSGGELKFRKASAGAIIGAFRAYLDASSATAPVLDAEFTDGSTTYVGKIQANGEVEITDAYNLAGQRISKGQKGVNIVNGKKVVVK